MIISITNCTIYYVKYRTSLNVGAVVVRSSSRITPCDLCVATFALFSENVK